MRFFVVVVIFLVVGCAATYRPPVAIEGDYSEGFSGSRAELFNSAKRELALMGYSIQMADLDSGVISTSPKSVNLGPSDADCGTTMGIDYLKDKRTNTTVALNIIIDSATVKVRSSIFGEYRPGDVTQNITLTCVSTGSVEGQVLMAIL